MRQQRVPYRSAILILLLCGIYGMVLLTTGSLRVDAAARKARKPAPPQATFVGTETCTQCHGEAQDHLKAHFHGQAMMAAETKGKGHLCEGCHGPGSLHAENPSSETAAPLKLTARNGKGCLSCHRVQLSPTKWQRSEHLRGGIGCVNCHQTPLAPPAPKAPQTATPPTPKLVHGLDVIAQPHGQMNRAPSTESCLSCHREKRAELALPSHHPVMEGRVGCADCHQPHQPMGKEITRQVCVTCHAKQSGPYRFEHAATSGHLTEACLECHRAHGSPNPRLLKYTNRALCLQCHADRVTHFPGQTCQNCHKAVHGSNSDTLLFAE